MPGQLQVGEPAAKVMYLEELVAHLVTVGPHRRRLRHQLHLLLELLQLTDDNLLDVVEEAEARRLYHRRDRRQQ